MMNLDEIKRVELKILEYVNSVCKINKLTYSLTAGTLIGAIRHKGFIPWDDDIDIMMPRPDYNKLLHLISNNDSVYKVECCEYSTVYPETFAKLYDSRTIIIDKNANNNQIKYGVWIDIFPIDGLGQSASVARKIVKEGKLSQLLLVCSTMNKFTRSSTHSFIFEPVRFFFYLVSRFCNSNKLAKRINLKNQNRAFHTSLYAGCVCGSYREKTMLLSADFYDVEEIEFESLRLSAIKKSDVFLTNCYGDYMKLPPKNKRVTHHTFNAFWKDE